MGLVETTNLIVSCLDRRDEIWNGRKKFSFKHEDKLRKKIHDIDETIERLFHQLWNDDEDAAEEIDAYEDPWGRMRIVWCDGTFHFITTKSDKLVYGIMCDC